MDSNHEEPSLLMVLVLVLNEPSLVVVLLLLPWFGLDVGDALNGGLLWASAQGALTGGGPIVACLIGAFARGALIVSLDVTTMVASRVVLFSCINIMRTVEIMRWNWIVKFTCKHKFAWTWSCFTVFLNCC